MTQTHEILIVEDDILIAMDLEDELVDRGFVVLGCAATVARARELLAETKPTLVVLDMHLRSETTFDLATDLRAMGVPFLFISGNATSALPAGLQDSTVLTKPVQLNTLIDTISGLVDA